jgi:16S rRNA (guanine527-N7)-methyltransferase
MMRGGGRQGRGRDTPRMPFGSPAEIRAALSIDHDRAVALTPVSRETGRRLENFVTVLLAWQRRMNLIAPSTESTLWTRHIADSLQLPLLAPQARIWVDLGSGAGFPGLVIACALAETPGAIIHLVESNAKKAAFLREAVRVTETPARVHADTIENFAANVAGPFDAVTARALAPLPALLAAAYPLLKNGALGLFPKGQDVASELTEAAKYWKIQRSLTLSRTDPNARIVVVRGLEPKFRPPPG